MTRLDGGDEDGADKAGRTALDSGVMLSIECPSLQVKSIDKIRITLIAVERRAPSLLHAQQAGILEAG
jgi:hypothetical protein